MKLLDYLKKNSSELVGVLLVAILCSFCMKDIVNDWSDAMLPEKTFSVRAVENDGNRNVTIVYEGNQNELFTQLKDASNKAETGWAYVEGEPGVRWTSLTLPPENGEVTITAKQSPRLYLTVFGNREGGMLEFNIDGETVSHDCYLDVDSTQLLRLFPFQTSKLFFVIKAIIYLFLVIFFSSIFLGFGYMLKKQENEQGGIARAFGLIRTYFGKPITALDFFICWLGLFALAVFIYKIVGIPNYLVIGDESGYWNELILNMVSGKWDVAMLAGRFAPRGYWCYIPQSIAHYIGDAILVDASIIWMLIPSATVSWLVVEIFPRLYEVMGEERRAKKLHILPILIVMITTWRECLTCVTMDLFGVVFLFAGVYYMLHFFKKRRWTSAVLAGVLSSIAVSFRTANLLGIVAVVFYELIMVIIHRRGETRKSVQGTLMGICIGLLAFVAICLPQLQVNLYRNHPGLFPYDHDQAWFGRSLTVWSSDFAMTDYCISYPLTATDDQLRSMKESAYVRDVPLNMEQLLDTYMESPIETLMLIGKKLVIGFDKKTNIGYPNPGPGVPWRKTRGMFFSLWNYFVLFAGLYVMIRGLRKDHSQIVRKEMILALLVFVFLVLPETFMKIEWRYVFAGYMMLYYFFTFHFVGPFLQSREDRTELIESSRFVMAFVIYAFVYFACSFTLLA